MPPKVTDTRTAQNEALHQVEEKTAAGARRIVATFADDFYDAGRVLLCSRRQCDRRRIVADLLGHLPLDVLLWSR